MIEMAYGPLAHHHRSRCQRPLAHMGRTMGTIGLSGGLICICGASRGEFNWPIVIACIGICGIDCMACAGLIIGTGLAGSVMEPTCGMPQGPIWGMTELAAMPGGSGRGWSGRGVGTEEAKGNGCACCTCAGCAGGS